MNAGYKFVGWFKEGAEAPVTTERKLSADTAKENLNVNAETGRYAATTFTARFETDEAQTATVFYRSQNTAMGTVNAAEEKIQVILSGVNEQVRATLVKSSFARTIGEENICSNIHEALKRAEVCLKS